MLIVMEQRHRVLAEGADALVLALLLTALVPLGLTPASLQLGRLCQVLLELRGVLVLCQAGLGLLGVPVS